MKKNKEKGKNIIYNLLYDKVFEEGIVKIIIYDYLEGKKIKRCPSCNKGVISPYWGLNLRACCDCLNLISTEASINLNAKSPLIQSILQNKKKVEKNYLHRIHCLKCTRLLKNRWFINEAHQEQRIVHFIQRCYCKTFNEIRLNFS